MFCLCMCALLKFIKVFCIVLYILMTLLVHCLSQSPAPPSRLRTGSPLDGPTQTLRSARTKIVSHRLSGKSGSRPFLRFRLRFLQQRSGSQEVEKSKGEAD